MKENELKSYTLMPEEVEAILQNNFGDKLQPVDNVMLEQQKRKQQQHQANMETYKTRFQKEPKGLH
ncbi:MAG: hypothetical protein P4N59_14895 [Negativicutes bacterium]|nr:hypothetical protein [Negativicutes bacterium]